jgi:hypothetical protein
VNRVYIFHGYNSRFANAVFTSVKKADAWITCHALTGLLTGYDVDYPAYDHHLAAGSLPKRMLKTVDNDGTYSELIEQFVDGHEHYHYFYGHNEQSPGYLDALDRWEKRHEKPQ